MELDAPSLRSVRAFASAFTERCPSLDVLVNNAAASVPERELTEDGFERHWATNVLGPHLLTTLLLPVLKASGGGRVVNVSTRAAGGLDLSDTQYERPRFRGVAAYRASKQASRMLAWALADQLAGYPRDRQRAQPRLRVFGADSQRHRADEVARLAHALCGADAARRRRHRHLAGR
jgi:NAD(P)-dependent dehydrogenase (short-subunit alcohol dehydrogenase family)